MLTNRLILKAMNGCFSRLPTHLISKIFDQPSVVDCRMSGVGETSLEGRQKLKGIGIAVRRDVDELLPAVLARAALVQAVRCRQGRVGVGLPDWSIATHRSKGHGIFQNCRGVLGWGSAAYAGIILSVDMHQLMRGWKCTVSVILLGKHAPFYVLLFLYSMPL